MIGIYTKREHGFRYTLFFGGMDGTRTRDPLRDRQVF